MKIELVEAISYIFCANEGCEKLTERIKVGTTCVRFHFRDATYDRDETFYICGGCIDSVFKDIRVAMDPKLRAFT
jgi:hypothetical protein